MKKLLILGTGGNCLDILDAALAVNAAVVEPVYDCVGFLDDAPDLQGREICGLKVVGTLKDAAKFHDCYFVNGIGSPASFVKKHAILKGTGVANERFETIVHPQASVSRFSTLGRGCVLLAGAVVCARAEIGQHVIMLSGAVANHDCRVGDYSCLSSGACLSGGVVVEPSSYIGNNASVISGVRIGPRSLVGMGSVVLEDVPEGHVVAGIPARYLRQVQA